MGKAAQRSDDEMVLAMLKLRESGMSTGQIGKLFGKPSSYIRTVTNRVYDAMGMTHES